MPCLSKSKLICLAIAALGLVGLLRSPVWAMGEVQEEQLTRFEELRAAKELTCNIWARGLTIEFGALDSGPPATALNIQEDRPHSLRALLVFDEQKTRVLHYSRTEDFFAGRARLLPPVAALFSAQDGAVLIPPYNGEAAFPDHFDRSCLLSLTGCRSTFQILADPEIETYFPYIATAIHRIEGIEGDDPARAFVLVGRCRPGIGQEARRQVADRIARYDIRNYAACGRISAQSYLGTYGLLVSQPSGEDLMEAYKWLRIARENASEIAPKRWQIPPSLDIAIEIAADRMTADEIAEADRRVAAWQPDPSQCEEAPEAEARERE